MEERTRRRMGGREKEVGGDEEGRTKGKEREGKGSRRERRRRMRR